VSQAAEPARPAQPPARPTPGAAHAAWAAAAPAPAGELDLDRVQRGWPQVLDRVRSGSRVTAMYLELGRPVALEGGRRVLLDFPASARFQSEALNKDDRQRQLETVLAEVFGTALSVRATVGEDGAAPAADAEPARGRAARDAGAPARGRAPARADQDAEAWAAVPPPPEPDDEFDPSDGPGEVLGADADTRAVADLAARAFGGQVIDERPND
jgi:hypothetical protein